ncbi:P44/Msp2 family outer membrane protein [Sphingorhabdus sp. Alg239-R122]|uniref:P44/Msp2 family outer membrane protein n=1 Tax=Sphingorhabdus sp. Alg239-R122 TaxID=2305989 RepID=UPI0013D94779|nr:P44/Msp2 family outer membrane protein [Sphingorhabdus sp. Alg239-R122]
MQPVRNRLTIFATMLPLSLSLTGQAMAQEATEIDHEGFYVSSSIGAEFLNDSSFRGVQNPDAGVPGIPGGPADINVAYDTGFSVNGAVGYKIQDSLLFDFLKSRVEVEVGYSESDVSGGTFNGGNQTFSGDVSTFTATAGLYSDVVWSANQKIIPYFGSAIGLAVLDTDVQYFPNNGVATAPTFGVRGSKTAFVTQSRLGLTIKATDKVDVFAEGRYQKIYGRNFDRRFIANGNDGFNASVRDDTESFGAGLGIRFNF